MCQMGPITARNPIWLLSEGEAMAARKKRPTTAFAVPKSSPVGGKGKGKYPIPDLAHARNALSRVSAHGSAAEKKMVKSAVKRKYPGLAKRSSVIKTGKRK